jgi:very-short-patch-repair endonuclease
LALGLGRRAIGHRLETGRLTAIHRGVYAVGHPALGPRGRAVAALRAVGPGAVLSHRSAAAIHGLLAATGAIEVTVAGRAPRSRAGIIVHRAASLGDEDTCRRDGLPLTSPIRTLIDLAGVLPRPPLERVLAEAQVLRLVHPPELKRAVERAHGRRGVARLARILRAGEPAPTRSQLERTFLRLAAAADLERPRVNERVGRFMVDFLWPAQRVVVETDGWAAHGHRAAFTSDRARDAELQALGFAVLRFTYGQVTEEPVRVAARIAAVLALRGAGRRHAA